MKLLSEAGCSFGRGMPHRKESQLQVKAVAMALCYSFNMLYRAPGSLGQGNRGREERSRVGLGGESHCSQLFHFPLAVTVTRRRGAAGEPTGKE